MYVCVCTEKGEVVELTVDHIWQIPNATDQNLVRLAHSTGWCTLELGDRDNDGLSQQAHNALDEE